MDNRRKSKRGTRIRPGEFGFGDSIRIPERTASGGRHTAYRVPSMEEPLAPLTDVTPTQPSRGGPRGLGSTTRPTFSTARRAVIVICALLGFFFSTMDAAIVATSLVTISDRLDGKDNQLHWVVLAYLLTYMGFAVFCSQLSDVYGRRDVQLLSWTVFCCFSLACATSKNMVSLIVCRAFQGIGGSGLYTLSQVTIAEYGPTHSSPLVGIMIGVTLALALVIGPIVGGLISRWDWTWIFSINIPFSAATSLALVCAWPLTPGEPSLSKSGWRALGSTDIIGSGALLCAVSFLVIGLQEAGLGELEWSDAAVITTISLAAVSFVLFVAWQAILSRYAFRSIHPAFPLQILRNRVYASALVVTLLSGYSYFSLMVIIPGRFQRVNGQDAFHAGLRLVPMLGATAVGSFIGGAINAKKNLTFYTLIASSTLQVVGIGLMTTLNNVATDVSAQYGFQVLIGFAVGLCFSAGTVLTSLHVPSNMLATGHGILSQARIMGGCVGIAVCTVVFQYTASPEVQHEDGSTGETVDPRVKYADGFYENVKIMLYVATVSVFVSILTLEWNPPQMRTLRQHRLNLDNNEEAGRRSISTKGSRSTELREIENSPLTVPSDGKV